MTAPTPARAATPAEPPKRIPGVGGAIVRGVLTVALHPLVTMPGYWVATGFGLAWGGALSRGRIERTADGLIVASGLPSWSFGRGGTTVGGVYLTKDNVGAAVLEHEAVHRRQWRRFGLAMLPLYYASGIDPLRNHFEIQADLVKGGYVRRRPAQPAVSRRAGPRDATQA